jgi:hypothetical protein
MFKYFVSKISSIIVTFSTIFLHTPVHNLLDIDLQDIH